MTTTSKKSRVGTLLVFFVVTVIAYEQIVSMPNHFFAGNQADDSANLQNEGHIYTLQPWLPYNQGDLIVVNWNGNQSSLHENAGAVTEMWVTIGSAWTTGQQPPSAVCDKDSSVPGCSPPENLQSSWTFGHCHECDCTEWEVSHSAVNATGYAVEQSLYSTGPWTEYSTTSTGMSYPHNGANGRWFRIKASNGAGSIYGTPEWKTGSWCDYCGGGGEEP